MLVCISEIAAQPVPTLRVRPADCTNILFILPQEFLDLRSTMEKAGVIMPATVRVLP